MLSFYKGRETGSYHPRMMLKVQFHAYQNNIHSCRKTQKALRENTHSMWLSWTNTSNLRTINNFRANAYKLLFLTIILLLQESGYVPMVLSRINILPLHICLSWQRRNNKVKLESKIEAVLCLVDKHIGQDNSK